MGLLTHSNRIANFPDVLIIHSCNVCYYYDVVYRNNLDVTVVPFLVRNVVFLHNKDLGVLYKIE